MENWSIPSQERLYNSLKADRTYSSIYADLHNLEPYWDLVFSIKLYQLVCIEPIQYKGPSIQFRPLDYTDIPAMLALTALTKPGPFIQRTIEFGNYVGIFEKEKLVAMAGERLHLPNYTEVSAVCTHPDHNGKGYAACLVNHLVKQIIEGKKAAFLHVRKDNERAIQLYKGLGFEIRREMNFVVIKKKY